MNQISLFETLEENLHAGQHCYYSDGFMFCNFVVKWGRRIKPKVKEMLRFPAKKRLRQRKKKNKRSHTLIPNKQVTS